MISAPIFLAGIAFGILAVLVVCPSISNGQDDSVANSVLEHETQAERKLAKNDLHAAISQLIAIQVQLKSLQKHISLLAKLRK